VFGQQGLKFSFASGKLALQCRQSGDEWLYSRTCGTDRIEKLLTVSPDAAITINPVEPVNLPLEIAHHLEIVFPQIVMGPGQKKTVYLKFPVEIGVFLQSGNDISVIDIFSQNPTKYSLYGKPVTGLITRYYESGIYAEIPGTDRFYEGVITLLIDNTSASAVEVSRVVLECHTMKLFYGDRVGMRATMQIASSALAITSFDSVAPEGCPNRAIDLYTSRKLPIIPGQDFYMDSGVA
jgi:hypothetical protein